VIRHLDETLVTVVGVSPSFDPARRSETERPASAARIPYEKSVAPAIFLPRSAVRNVRTPDGDDRSARARASWGIKVTPKWGPCSCG
jgi:hypothetical protein